MNKDIVYNKFIETLLVLNSYLVPSMTTATSQIQKHFMMHSIYKRSKNYFDVERLKEQEHIQEINRRKPNYSIQTFDTRVDQSFVNAADTGRRRLQHDISSYKKRYQDEKSETFTNSDTIIKYLLENQEQLSEFRASKTKIKAPDLSKMLPRKGIDIKKTIYRNEDQFNNFFIGISRSKAQLNFSLLSPRSKSSLDYINPEKIPSEIDSIEVNKSQQKNVFSSSVYRCLFDYSKELKNAKLSRKKQYKSQPKQIDEQKLNKASQSVFVNPNIGQSQFYFGIGHDDPAQMNMRYNRPNELYFKSIQDRKSNEDYSCKKRKEDMKGKRLSEILKKKKVIDSRDQLCDYKFFNRSSFRKK